MSRTTIATWAAINLVAGLLLTFLAPTASGAIAIPISVGYPSAFGLMLSLFSWRNRSTKPVALFTLAGLSLFTGFACAGIPVNNPGDNFHQVIAYWALGQAALLLAARKFAGRHARDLFIVAVASALLGVAMFLPDFQLRDTLGFFSAYLLITGVLLGIAAATDQK